MLGIWLATSMIPRHIGNYAHFFRRKSGKIGMGYQIVGVFVMFIFTNMMSDIMKEGRIFQPLPFLVAKLMQGHGLIEQT